MKFLKQFDLESLSAPKLIGLALAALVLVLIGLNIAGISLKSITGMPGMNTIAPSMGYGGYDGAMAQDSYAYDSMSGEYAYGKGGGGTAAMMPELSARNVAISYPYPPMPTGTAGDEAEEYEVTQYNAQIETRRLEQVCDSFGELKKRTDVIFENANTGDTNCNFTFKVKTASVAGVLEWLRTLNPKNLSEDTYTIKNQVDDFTNEVDVLTKKRASIDDTLSKALVAYDEITRLATNTENADALAKIIDSKIGIIERLTQERININEQLDRLSRAKAEQLDRLDYTYFYVNVYENKYIDAEQIGDSWKEAVRQFIRDLNTVIQNMTINLILLLFVVVQWLIYGVIALFVAKYTWKFAKHIWKN